MSKLFLTIPTMWLLLSVTGCAYHRSYVPQEQVVIYHGHAPKVVVHRHHDRGVAVYRHSRHRSGNVVVVRQRPQRQHQRPHARQHQRPNARQQHRHTAHCHHRR